MGFSLIVLFFCSFFFCCCDHYGEHCCHYYGYYNCCHHRCYHYYCYHCFDCFYCDHYCCRSYSSASYGNLCYYCRYFGCNAIICCFFFLSFFVGFQGRWLPPSGFEPSQSSCREVGEGEGKIKGEKEEAGAWREKGKKGGSTARTRGQCRELSRLHRNSEVISTLQYGNRGSWLGPRALPVLHEKKMNKKNCPKQCFRL